MPGVRGTVERLARLYEPHVSPSSLVLCASSVPWSLVRPWCLVHGPACGPSIFDHWTDYGLRTERGPRTDSEPREAPRTNDALRCASSKPILPIQDEHERRSRRTFDRHRHEESPAVGRSGHAPANGREDVGRLEEKPRFPQTRPRRPSFPSGPARQYACEGSGGAPRGWGVPESVRDGALDGKPHSIFRWRARQRGENQDEAGCRRRMVRDSVSHATADAQLMMT